MTRLRATAILAAFLAVTMLLLPFQWLASALGLSARKTIPHRYHRIVCHLIGIRLTILGVPAKGSVLMTANHNGWIDIPILSAVAPVSFIAKEDVRQWPFFGMLARLQRTIFIRRERGKAMADRDHIRRRLRQGDSLVIFPEGTSSDGNRVLPFRSALLSAAEIVLSENAAHRPVHAPVQPVSIAYVRLHGIPMGRENRPFFAWYGDMELLPHLWEAFKKGPIDVTVEFHAPVTLESAGGRKALALTCEAAVRAGLVRALTGSNAPAEPPHRDEALIEALDGAEDAAEAAA